MISQTRSSPLVASQVFKYTLVYIIVVAFLAALIVLRTSFLHPNSSEFITNASVIAALFRDHITFNYTVCQNI